MAQKYGITKSKETNNLTQVTQSNPNKNRKNKNKQTKNTPIMKHERLKPMQSCNKPKTTKELEAQNKNHQYT